MLHFWFSLLLCVTLLAGCAKPPAEKLRVFWPALPAKPYIEWLGSYASAQDFEKTEGEKFLNQLTGDQQRFYFGKATGIVGDSERGLVYVADGDRRNIFVFDFNKRTVTPLSAKALGDFPAGLALDSQNYLYMCDSGGGVVLKISPDGVPVAEFGKGVLRKPAHLAINERLGRIYVSDSLEHTIQVFDMAGEPLFAFGELGPQAHQLFGPQGIAIDAENRVFVADQLNARIQVFDADGLPLYRFGTRGDKTWNFEGPRGLAVDSDGNLWVTDVRKSMFFVYDPQGTLLLDFFGGLKPTQLLSIAFPSAVSIDRNDRVYISDLVHQRFQVWQFFSTAHQARQPLSEEEKQRQLQLRKKAAAASAAK